MFPALNILPRRRRGPLYEDDEPAPVPIRPALPAPRPPTPPVYAEPIATERVQPESVAITPPPLTTTDRRGRPQIIGGLGASEQPAAEQQLIDQLQSYQPRKRSILRQIGMGALRGFVAGGPGGAISGGIFGAGTALLDPLAEDEAWRQKQLAQAVQRQQITRAQQRQGLQDDLLRAQVDETQAQAEQRRNPRPRLVEQVNADGTTTLVPEMAGVVTGRPKPAAPTYSVDIPGYGPVTGLDANDVTGYYGQVGRQRTEAEIREGERLSNFERARVSLTQAESDEKTYLQSRKEASDALGKLRTARSNLKPNPALVGFNGQINDPDYWRQADALDAQIKDAESEVNRRQGLADEATRRKTQWQGEVGRYGTRPPSTAPPPPAGVTEASVRAEARRRGQDEDAAVRKARELRWIP